MSKTFNPKAELRKRAKEARDNIEHRNQKSAKLRARIESHPRFQIAKSVLIYLDIRSEVQTTELVADLIRENSKTVFIPYCQNEHLGIFRLEDFAQLEKKSFGLLEPKEELIEDSPKPSEHEIDLIIVPGLAFDSQLNRLGYGRGHYDRLLANELPESYRIAIAFEEQIVERIPTEKFDEPMDEVVTDLNRYWLED